MKRLPVMLLAGLLTTHAGASDECPLDRVTFVDSTSGAQFIVDRVAEDYGYDCPSGWTENPPDDEDCRGPFGDLILEGSLNGSKVFAVFNIVSAAPCCIWYSYSEADAPDEVTNATWLAHEDVPSVALGDEWYLIGPPNPPNAPDTGPMGDGAFLPTICRSND